MPILDISYRSRQLAFRRTQISQWLSYEHSQLQEEIQFRKVHGESVDEDYVNLRVANLEKEATIQEKDALGMYGMLEGSDPRIAPLRRALAVWGLTADDIGVLSIHGTSTGANVSQMLLLLLDFADLLIGGKRDQDLERYLHNNLTYTWECRSNCRAEEPSRSRKGGLGSLANGRIAANRHHWYRTWQQEQRVSTTYHISRYPHANLII